MARPIATVPKRLQTVQTPETEATFDHDSIIHTYIKNNINSISLFYFYCFYETLFNMKLCVVVIYFKTTFE